eukprot:scaffold11046_cov183-Amphora_coffeaeformis.AAC.12
MKKDRSKLHSSLPFTQSDVQVGRAKSSRKKAKQSEKSEPVYTRVPTNTKSISSLLTNLKQKLKSQPYDKIVSNRIVHAALMLQLEYCKAKVKKDGVKPPAPKIQEKIC